MKNPFVEVEIIFFRSKKIGGKKTRECVTRNGVLAIYIKKYLKGKKEELWKLKYFTMQKYNLWKNKKTL
jgi:hypothetical protein